MRVMCLPMGERHGLPVAFGMDSILSALSKPGMTMTGEADRWGAPLRCVT
jgi:hypothetical protein